MRRHRICKLGLRKLKRKCDSTPRFAGKMFLVNTPRLRPATRIGALFALLPVIILIHNVGFSPKVNVMAFQSLSLGCGFEGKAFAKTAFFNFDIKPTWNDALLAFGIFFRQQFTMTLSSTSATGKARFVAFYVRMPR